MVSIIDYGAGNLQSLSNSFQALGEPVAIIKEGWQIKQAKKLVLPGVGSFGSGMSKLQDIVEDIQKTVLSGVPILGICLGMHLLADEGEEDGPSDGLFLFPGRVIKLPCQTLPHIGWSKVSELNDNTYVFNDDFYFLHSYFLNVEFKDEIIGLARHENFDFPAVVARDNIMGCQFHPEKSGHAGMSFLRTWLAEG